MYSQRVEEAVTQLACHKALKAVRAYIPPKEILKTLRDAEVEISPVDLSRYISGYVLPAPDKAQQILEAIHARGLVEKVFRTAVEVDSQGVVNVPLVAYNVLLLELASSIAFLHFRREIDTVITAAINGIPLASMVASFIGARLAVARRERESPTIRYIEAGLFLKDPPNYVHLYVPGDSIRRGDRVLIVDDLFRTGRTFRALLRIAEEAQASVVGGFSMIALGDAWREVVSEELKLVTLVKL